MIIDYEATARLTRDALKEANEEIASLKVQLAQVENQCEEEAVTNAGLRLDIIAAEARGIERAAIVAGTYKRDASFDDSMVGAQEHNANQANIADAIRALAAAKDTP